MKPPQIPEAEGSESPQAGEHVEMWGTAPRDGVGAHQNRAKGYEYPEHSVSDLFKNKQIHDLQA